MTEAKFVDLPATATPLREVVPGLLVKFECDLPGGSHKVRAARFVVRHALQMGHIVPGETTVIEKTGGNFGLGLALACSEIHVPVELAVGLSFSAMKRRCLALAGAKLIGIDRLERGETPRQVLEWHLAHANELGRSYYYPDQFQNPACVLAHEFSTGAEIAQQLRTFAGLKALHFVGCAGTGAHLTGITRALRHAGFLVETTLVEPEGCDSRAGVFASHALEGMSVGVPPPLLDWSLITSHRTVGLDQVLAVRARWAARHGMLVGNTTAACIAVAQEMAAHASRDTKTVVLAYEHGHWYL